MSHSSLQSNSISYDLIIVGGGLVGRGLALALKDSGWRIALVDATQTQKKDQRLFALNASSCQFLENIGLWSLVHSYATPIHQVHVSYQGRFGTVRLNNKDVGIPTLGHVVPAQFIESAMDAVKLDANLFHLYRPATVEKIIPQEQDSLIQIKDEDGEQRYISAPLIIAADGADSTIREQLHIPTEKVDYQQSAIVTRTALTRAHENVAYERFVKEGAIAMLPLQDNESATIWSADNATIAALLKLSESDFLAELQSKFGYRLGRLKSISTRHVFPLRKVQAKNNVEHNVLLLGNAAHTLHPIAAQGFNLAIFEMAMLAEDILESLAQGKKYLANNLQEIAQKIQKTQALSINVSHGLAQTVTKQSLLSCAFGLGMMGLDIATPIKKHFIARMVGRYRQVPRLLLNQNG